MADWYAYDLKAKKKVKILNPRIVKMGVRYAVTGESEDTGIPVYHFVGGKKTNTLGHLNTDRAPI